MSKAERVKRQSARERIAAQQAAARRAETRRRALLAGGAIVIVIAVVVAFIVIKANQSPSSSSGSTAEPVTGTVLPSTVAKNITAVPGSALDAVGTGSVLSYNPKPVSAITGNALTSAGKPEMLYIGAEFCPYCAAMRWSMAVALSRFGTLQTPFHGIHSSSSDTLANTPTLTFYKSSGYSSRYLTFSSVENETRTHALLQKPTAAQQQIWQHYSPSGLGYPFIDFGNKFLINQPIYDGAVLKDLTWQQVSVQLRNPSSPVAQGILGAANFVTAAICKTTNGQPGNVCTAKGVTAAASHL
jgi:hypothetical protein